MTKLTLGTAQIVAIKGGFVLRYMNSGSFIIGERTYRLEVEAREFCRDRGLRIIP